MTPLRSALSPFWPLLAGIALGVLGCGPQDPGPPRNLLLISLDTLRADHLQPYGYEQPTSPNMQQLADEGVVFENALATSNWTLPTHCSLFTGLHPTVHGVQGPNDRLDTARATLGEALTGAGYRTAGYFSNPFLAERFGYGRGFEVWSGVQDADTFQGQIETRGSPKGSVSRSRPRPPGVRSEDYFVAQSSDLVTSKALEFLDGHDGTQPFGLFLHYNDCHSDYIPPEPYDWMFSPDYQGELDGEDYTRNKRVRHRMPREDLARVKALYDGEIAWVDSHIGRLLDRLESDGLLDDTLVVVTADHGEGFFEHQQKEHHYGLWMELVHIPWIMRLPGRIPPGTRVAHAVSQADIAPTLLDLLHVDGLPEADGISWAAWADGSDDEPSPRPVTSTTILKPLQDEQGAELFAYRDDRLSAIARREPDGPERLLIYAWELDRRERRALDEDHNTFNLVPRLLDETRAELAARRDALQWADGDASLPDDPELLEQMRQWGYIK